MKKKLNSVEKREIQGGKWSRRKHVSETLKIGNHLILKVLEHLKKIVCNGLPTTKKF